MIILIEHSVPSGDCKKCTTTARSSYGAIGKSSHEIQSLLAYIEEMNPTTPVTVAEQ